MLEMLIKYGADVNHKDNKNKTLLQYAAELGSYRRILNEKLLH